MRVAIIVVALGLGVACSSPPHPVYPPAHRGDVVDKHAGVDVPDPYRWLEDMESADAKTWVAAENKVTDAYFARLPRERLKQRLTALMQRSDQRHRDGPTDG